MDKINYYIDGDFFIGLINNQGQYSLWPCNKNIPSGWKKIIEPDTKTNVLGKIEELWADMRPNSLKLKD